MSEWRYIGRSGSLEYETYEEVNEDGLCVVRLAVGGRTRYFLRDGDGWTEYPTVRAAKEAAEQRDIFRMCAGKNPIPEILKKET